MEYIGNIQGVQRNQFKWYGFEIHLRDVFSSPEPKALR